MQAALLQDGPSDVLRKPAVRRRNGWFWFVLVASSLHFALVYTLNTVPFLDLNAFLAGRERAPFQYRALTAWLFSAVRRLGSLPEFVLHHLPGRLQSIDALLLLTLVAISLLTAVLAIRATLRLLGIAEEFAGWWALLVVPMAVCHYLLSFGHPCCAPLQLPYDLPSLAFFALALWALVADRLLLFSLIFTVATLNRESSIFLLLLLVLYRSPAIRNVRSPGLVKLASVTVVLALVWVAIRLWLHGIYGNLVAGGPHAGSFELHLVDNLTYLLRPYYWTSYASMFAFTWPYLFAHWMEIPNPAIRRALLLSPIYLVCLYVVGVLSEVRIFGELIPLHVVAFTLLMRARHPALTGTVEVQA